VFRGFEGVGYARLDFRLDKSNEPVFLEINFTCSMFYPYGYEGTADHILALDGMGPQSFLRAAIREARERWHNSRPAFKLGQSSISGFGIFATRPMSAGEIAFRGEGGTYRLASRYWVRRHWPPHDQASFFANAVPVSPKLYSYWLPDPETWAPQNHSCNPNTAYFGLDVMCIRDVGEGEELTLDYRMVYGADLPAIECRCGSPNCAGRIGWNNVGTP
jgi:D-alanine-D-alanine ligase